MKRILENVAIMVAGIVIVAGGVTIANTVGQTEALPFGGGYGPVILDSLTPSATSTGSFSSDVPVKVLDGDPSRTYAVFSNRTDTPIYLYVVGSRELSVDGTGDATFPAGAATSTITELNGIYLVEEAIWESDDTNLVTGFVYASSTVAGKIINVSYK